MPRRQVQMRQCSHPGHPSLGCTIRNNYIPRKWLYESSSDCVHVQRLRGFQDHVIADFDELERRFHGLAATG